MLTRLGTKCNAQPRRCNNIPSCLARLDNNSREGGGMFADQHTTQNIDSVRVAALLLATALVVFWRPVIKLVIMLLAIAVIAGLGIGAFVLLQSTHYLIG